MALELVTPLPPGAPSHTRLAKHGARLVVLREILDGTDCSWPDPSPQMVTLQEVGELQGKRHALFAWVPGVTLRETLAALEQVGRPVPLGLIGRVLIDTARALSAISPPRPHAGLNDGALQIGFDGQISVLDFGAPRLSRFRPIGRVNFAADVFALGGVMHSALTGYQGEYAARPATLPAPSTSHAEATPALDDVVMRALSPQPDARQSSVGAFADELEAVLGDDLYSATQLAEVVSRLFKDRIKLLQSLGGLIEEHPSLEADLPHTASSPVYIPGGTQPGEGGPPPDLRPERTQIVVEDGHTDVRIPVPGEAPATRGPRSMVPWDSATDLPRSSDAHSEGTQPGVRAPVHPEAEPLTGPAGPPLSGPRPPRAAQREPVTNPGAPAPTRDSEPATNPRAPVPQPPAEAEEATGPRLTGAPAPRATGPAAPARPPPAGRPARSAESEAAGDSSPHELVRSRPSAPRPLGAEDEHSPTRASGPRALSRSDLAAVPAPDAPPALAHDTNPRAHVPDLTEDTAPRARPPEPPPRPRASAARPSLEEEPRPRNTTEAERHRAIGQERLRTPPQGVEIVGAADDPEEREPTAVRPRTSAAIENAQTAQRLPVAPAAPSSGGSGVRVVMVLLLLVVVGLAAGVLVKLKRESERPLEPVEEPLLVLDAGAEPTPDAGPAPLDAGAVLAAVADAGEADAGEEDDEEEVDAGTTGADAGSSVDAGAPDAGDKTVKKPVKKPVKKKKRR